MRRNALYTNFEIFDLNYHAEDETVFLKHLRIIKGTFPTVFNISTRNAIAAIPIRSIMQSHSGTANIRFSKNNFLVIVLFTYREYMILDI